MPPKPRVTQSDIAERAGVHRSTVSLALKNHAGIPEETRKRVLEIAREMGYSPDPMLSALAIYRSRTRPQSFHGTLAWLVDGPEWQRVPAFRQYFEGAKLSAGEHGFVFSVFDAKAPHITPKRLSSILKTRNISGILVCPGPVADGVIRLDWSHFSAVSMSHSLADPLLHIVCAAHYRNMGRTLSELRNRGYRRIGVIINSDLDRKVDDSFLSRFLGHQYLLGDGVPIPPLFANYSSDDEAIRQWIERYHPEVLVVSDGQNLKSLPKRIEALGYRVPEDLGIVCSGLATLETNVSGVYETPIAVGEGAANFLISMIHRGERGVPERRQRLHLEGEWSEAETLKRSVKG